MVKFGVRNGVQRYQCRVCKKTLSDSPVNPLLDLRVPFDKAVQVVNLLCESTGIRACERLTGLNRRTVLSILEVAGQKAAQYLDANVRNVQAKFVQADEIHCIVGCREQNNAYNRMNFGAQFAFISIDKDSKLIINSVVGKRTTENALHLMEDLRSRMAGRFQLVTDNWKTYSGFDGVVRNVLGDMVDYATETKIFGKPGDYLPRTVIAIRRKARIGEPDMTQATTCHVERTNLSVRLFTRRFTRCTLGYSKKIENLRHAFALFVWHFNYVRVHSAHGKTPAMAAGLIGRPLTVADLF
jgi:IS1 family transposase